jgi:hypothetical protein
VVVSTAACGPNSSGAVSLVPRFVHESVHHIRPTSVPTRGLALQVIQTARSSPELAMELNGWGALPASQSGATILDFGQNLAGGHHRRPTPRPTRRVGRLGPTRPHPAPPPRGLLRPPRLQRPYPKPFTGASKPSAETPSDSATSPTTDCAHSCTAQPHPTDRRTLIPEEIWWTLAGPFAVDENRCAHVAFRRRFGLVCEAVEEIGAGALPGSGVPGCACEREYQPPCSF